MCLTPRYSLTLGGSVSGSVYPAKCDEVVNNLGSENHVFLFMKHV